MTRVTVMDDLGRRHTAMLKRLWEISRGMTRRYPEGDDPFKIVTRLAEECGELAAQVRPSKPKVT